MRLFIYALLFGISTTGLFAQKKIGIKLSPGVTLANLKQEDNPSSNDIQSINWGNKASLGFGFGLFMDFPFAENRLAFSTGLGYSMKNFIMDIETPIGVGIYNPETQNTTSFNISEDPQYLLHYLQLPITIKVFTNPTMNGNRFYFQAGATLELKIAEQALDKDNNYLYQLSEESNGGKSIFKSEDIGIYGAVGYELKLKSGKVFFGALSINKGLLKQMNSFKWLPGDPNMDYFMNVKLAQVGMEFGYLF
jgi:hypothetical protein